MISNNQLTFDFFKKSEKEKITPSQVLNLRDKIISDYIVTEKELNRSKELLQLREKELTDIKSHTSSLQSQLDKTKNIVKTEQLDKEKLYEKIDNLTNRLNLTEYNDKKDREINVLVDEEMKRIRKAFFITFGGYIGTGILVIILQIVLNMPDVKLIINLPTILDVLLNAILIIIAAIISNIAAGLEFKTKLKWLFKRNKLRHEVRQIITDNYEKQNPPPSNYQFITNE